MKYTIDDLTRDIDEINKQLTEIRTAKGHDYSGDDDTLANIRICGARGLIPRIFDKVMRLKQLVFDDKEPAVKDEKAIDTMMDLINYAYYLRIMYKQERSNK